MNWSSVIRFPREIPGIEPDIVFTIAGYGFSNSTLLLTAIALVILIFSLFVIRRFQMKPNGLQSIIEMIYEGLINLLKQITGDTRRAEQIFPVVASIFVFIGLANFAGLIPGIGTLSFNGVSIFRTPTSDFNTTFALALGSITAIQFISIKEWGLVDHINKYFQYKNVIAGFKNGLKSGMMSLVQFFIGLLDIIGEVAKIVSLSLRLFGNMYAGEVLMTILIGSLAYAIPSIWLAMSMLSALVQTVVFGSLVTVFYMLAIKPEQN